MNETAQLLQVTECQLPNGGRHGPEERGDERVS